MGKLAVFLAEKAEQLEAIKPERERLVRDWTEAVERLLGQIEGWVRASDPVGVLKVSRRNHSFNDELMGRYTVPGLVFDLDGRTAEVVPVARRVMASVPIPGEPIPRRAEGRVDLRGDIVDTFSIWYRVRDGDGDRWFVTHPGVANLRGKPHDPVPLTPEGFESELASLLG